LHSTPTITVTIGKARWKQVQSFAKSGPEDRHYLAETIGGKTTIRFGDGTRGAVPRSGSTIEAGYKTGHGASGNNVSITVRTTFGKTRDHAVRIAIRNRGKAISFSR